MSPAARAAGPAKPVTSFREKVPPVFAIRGVLVWNHPLPIELPDNGKTSLHELARDMTVQGALAVPKIEGTGAGVRADLERAMTRLRNLLPLLPDLR